MSVARDFAYAVAAVALGPVVLYRTLVQGKYRGAWRARRGHTGLKPDDRPTVLIHAVSVGEVNATRQLIARLEKRHGDDLRIVISVTTDTGTARAESLYGGRHPIVRFPLDFTRCVRRFLDQVDPDAAVFIELELWPNFVEQADQRGLPVIVINGRLSERSHRRYRWIRPLVRSMFEKITAAGVQDEAIGERFIDLGAPADAVTVTGTMKWDTAVIEDSVAGADELADEMGIDRSRPLVVCGSTGPGEEAMIIEKIGGLTVPWGEAGEARAVQMLMAPRKPERFDEAAGALGACVRRTEVTPGAERERRGASADGRFLLDTIGELRKAYALADAVVVGRSFCPLYGSDMMEPIALGKPTVIGPNTSDFAQQMEKLLAGDGIIQLQSIDALPAALTELLTTDRGRVLAENGRRVIRGQQGATDRHVAMIEKRLTDTDAGRERNG